MGNKEERPEEIRTSGVDWGDSSVIGGEQENKGRGDEEKEKKRRGTENETSNELREIKKGVKRRSQSNIVKTSEIRHEERSSTEKNISKGIRSPERNRRESRGEGIDLDNPNFRILWKMKNKAPMGESEKRDKKRKKGTKGKEESRLVCVAVGDRLEDIHLFWNRIERGFFFLKIQSFLTSFFFLMSNNK